MVRQEDRGESRRHAEVRRAGGGDQRCGHEHPAGAVDESEAELVYVVESLGAPGWAAELGGVFGRGCGRGRWRRDCLKFWERTTGRYCCRSEASLRRWCLWPHCWD